MFKLIIGIIYIITIIFRLSIYMNLNLLVDEHID